MDKSNIRSDRSGRAGVLGSDLKVLDPSIKFPFRTKQDLEAIAQFHRIIKNYLKMKDIIASSPIDTGA